MFVRKASLAAIGSAATLLVTTMAVGPVGASPSTPGVTSNSITIGFVSDLTGAAASSFFDSAGGIQARVALQNSHGGVNGRKIKLVIRDDQTNPINAQDAAASLAGQVFGVVEDSSVTFGAAKTLQQAGVPVTTGNGFDGPEWGQKPYTNMFDAYPVITSYGGIDYPYDWFSTFMKSVGVNKLGGLSYAPSPADQESIDDALTVASRHGISTCYNNKTIQFGAVDFTATALSIKSSGCNGVIMGFQDSSDVALAQAVKNAGANVKVLSLGTAYDNAVLASPANLAALQGVYISTASVDFTPPNAATQAMLNNLKKYDSQYKGGIPDIGTWVAYIGADLMIKGLELAGKNPTRASFLANLHKVTNYNAEGFFPSSVSFSLKSFGTSAMMPRTYCDYFVQVQGNKYVTINNGKPVCGKLTPVSQS